MEKKIKNIRIVNKLFISLFLYLSLLLLCPYSSLFSTEVVEEISEPKPSRLSFRINQLNPLDKIFYFSVDLSSGFSIEDSEFYPIQLDVGIKHSLYNTWLLGFNLGFFNTTSSGKDLYSFKISQEISYPFNLYHPFYILPGFRLGYAIPTYKNFNFWELDLSPDRDNFLFFSGFITILYYYSSNYSFYFRIDENYAIESSDNYAFLSMGLGIMFSF